MPTPAEATQRTSWKTCLIDGDVLTHRIGFACQTPYYDLFYKPEEEWGPIRTFNNKTDLNKYIKEQVAGGDNQDDYYMEEYVKADRLINALHSMKLQVRAILNATCADKRVILLSGRDNFRDKLVDYYKANRKDSKKPVYYAELREYLFDRWDAKIVHGREADDALSILQWRDFEAVSEWGDTGDVRQDANTIIATVDKDLDMVPGWHYSFVKKEIYYISEIEGYRKFYMQMLTGDSVDNIPGISKITGQRRKKGEWNEHYIELSARDDVQEMWRYVHDMYMSDFLNMDPERIIRIDGLGDAITTKLTEIGRLLHMQKHKEDLWKPPS